MALTWDPLAALSDAQRERLRQYADLLTYYNRRINLISRDGAEQQIDYHVRHVLALTARPFPPGSTVVDWGTGGGLPAIPLAVALPEVAVHAVDAVGKKVQAVQAMARRLGLANLTAWHGRAENWPGQAQYSVSRATAPLVDLWQWHHRVALPGSTPPDAWRPGLLCLKGGDLHEERAALQRAFPEAAVETLSLAPLIGKAYDQKYLLAVYRR